MCVYFVASMYADRIGVGWAHDVFTFACHMFIHFSCICTNYVSIFLILNYLVLFCLSLSLSLSFVSGSMAPKQKSAPSQNPLHSEASYYDSTPSHDKFCDDKACNDFLENSSWRGICSEYQVILLDFSNTDLPTIIYSKGWESLCGISVTCPSVIIQEFYSNMHRFEYSVPQFITRV